MIVKGQGLGPAPPTQLEEQPQNALQLALRRLQGSGDLPEIARSDVGIRVAVDRVVCNVKRLRAELQLEPLRQREVLMHRKVDGVHARTDQHVAAEGALAQKHAISIYGRRRQRLDVEVFLRIAGIGGQVADHVRPRIAGVAGSSGRKGKAALQGEDGIELPTADQGVFCFVDAAFGER